MTMTQFFKELKTIRFVMIRGMIRAARSHVCPVVAVWNKRHPRCPADDLMADTCGSSLGLRNGDVEAIMVAADNTVADDNLSAGLRRRAKRVRARLLSELGFKGGRP